MTTSNVGQELLSLLENDALVDFAPSLVTFLTGIQTANGDPNKQMVYWIQLQANLVAAAPTALGGLESQLAAVILGKLQTLVANAQAGTQADLGVALSGGVALAAPKLGGS